MAHVMQFAGTNAQIHPNCGWGPRTRKGQNSQHHRDAQNHSNKENQNPNRYRQQQPSRHIARSAPAQPHVHRSHRRPLQNCQMNQSNNGRRHHPHGMRQQHQQIDTQSGVSALQSRLCALFKSDDPRQIPHRPNVFNLMHVDHTVGRMDPGVFNKIRHGICTQWNPLFQSGCPNRRCSLQHLCEPVFLQFVHHVHTALQPDAAAMGHFERALRAFTAKMYQNALDLLMRLTMTYHFNSVINFWIARCLHSLGMQSRTVHRMHLANFHYRRALAIQPANGSFHGFYAQFSVDHGRMMYPNKEKIQCSEFKQAKQHFKRALNLQNCPSMHFCFARFLDEVEMQYPNAAFHYRHAIEGCNDHRVRLNYARCNHKMGKLSCAHSQFTTLIDHLESQNMHLSALWPQFHFARLLVDLGDHNGARERFLLCFEIMDRHNNRYFAEIFYEFAKLLMYHYGEHDLAIHYARTATKEAPEKRIYRKLFYRIKHCIQRTQRGLNQKKEEERPASQCTKTRPKGHCEDAQPTKTVVTERTVDDVVRLRSERETSPEFDRVVQGLENMQFGPLPFQKRANGQRPVEVEEVEAKEHSVGPRERKHTLNGQQLPDDPEHHDSELHDSEHNEPVILSLETAAVEEPEEERVDSDWTRFLSDDDGNSLSDDDQECADRLCQTEFDRFISTDNTFGPQFEIYCDRFEDEQLNDIRYLLTDQALDDTFLGETIEMKTECLTVWKESVSRFREQHQRFVAWLQDIGFYDEYYSILENCALLTLQSFRYHNKSAEDVIYIFGSRHKEDAEALWHSAQAQMERTG